MRFRLDIDLDSTLTEGKKISAKISDIKDDGAVRIEQQGSKLHLDGRNDAFEVCQTENLPASVNATTTTVETSLDGKLGTSDALDEKCSTKVKSIGELLSTHEAQTSPQKTLSVSKQIYMVEKANAAELSAPVKTQVIPAQAFDMGDPIDATESDPEAETPAPKVYTKSDEEHDVTDRKVDSLGSDHDNLKLKNPVPSNKNESGSSGVMSEKVDSKTHMTGTPQMQDDLDGEVTSAATVSHARSQSDSIEDIQKLASLLLAPLIRNKESIAPFNYFQQYPHVTKSPLFPCNKMNIRVPLKDITNLVSYSLPSTLVPQGAFLVGTSSPSANKFKCGINKSQGRFDSICRETHPLLSCRNFR